MSKVFKLDNRDLITNARYSYLTSNTLSGVSAIIVENADPYSADDYLLLGEYGNETSEIVKITTVSGTTLNLSSSTSFAHAESTRVTVLSYNQARLYHSTSTTFTATDPVTGFIDLQASEIFTQAKDTTNTTGYAFWLFYNSTTSKASSASNAIPYADFANNTVFKIFERFDSLLNNKERNLITNIDRFNYLNEAYNAVANEINLVNQEFRASVETSISVVSGTVEYSLESDFSNIISVYNDTEDGSIDPIDLQKVSKWNESSGNTMKYFLRNDDGTDKIGFSPVPGSAITVKVRYLKKVSTLTSYSDEIIMPDNAFYLLNDYMMFLSSNKLGRDGTVHYKLFKDKLSDTKEFSHKRNNAQDTWGLSKKSNI